MPKPATRITHVRVVSSNHEALRVERELAQIGVDDTRHLWGMLRRGLISRDYFEERVRDFRALRDARSKRR